MACSNAETGLQTPIGGEQGQIRRRNSKQLLEVQPEAPTLKKKRSVIGGSHGRVSAAHCGPAGRRHWLSSRMGLLWGLGKLLSPLPQFPHMQNEGNWHQSCKAALISKCVHVL